MKEIGIRIAAALVVGLLWMGIAWAISHAFEVDLQICQFAVGIFFIYVLILINKNL
jgi:hypothetical protein